MKVSFVLPCAAPIPIGGFKVIYEYANKFVERGIEVNIIHPALLYKDTSVLEKPKKWLRFIQRKIDKSFIPKWINLNPKIHLSWVPNLDEKYIPDSDIVIATAWQTAEWVGEYPKKKGIKVYFVHDYEHFMVSSDDVRKRICKTFKYFENIIVTSPAGEEMVLKCGKRPSLTVPNFIDFNVFYLEKDINNPERKNIIGIPVREEQFKGLDDSIKALSKVRLLFPEIKVWGFGSKKIKYLPNWLTFYYKPSNDLLRKLYNSTGIFVTASHFEGWGLPGSESMACGCALVTTDNVGCRAYVIDNYNALISQPKDINKLYENITKLLKDDELRIKIAMNGYRSIKKFTSDNSVKLFLDFLKKIS